MAKFKNSAKSCFTCFFLAMAIVLLKALNYLVLNLLRSAQNTLASLLQ